MTESHFDLVNYLNQKNRIIKDDKKFEPSFIPSQLVHREAELAQMAIHFKSILSSDLHQAGKQLVIQGSVGTGKTVSVKQFGVTLEKISNEQKRGIFPILFVHLNCRRCRSWYLILTRLLRQLVPAFPLRGFSTDELLSFLGKILTEKKIKLLLCLDEFDYLITTSQDRDVLYSLLRHHEGTYFDQAQISLFLITRNPHIETDLDEGIISSLSQGILRFEPYNLDQMSDILSTRANEGLYEESFSSEIIKQIAILAVQRKDARYAIELLWRSAKIAECEKSPFITFEHIRKAEVSVFPVPQSFITELPTQHKIILLALAKLLNNGPTSHKVTTFELRMEYEQLCDSKGVIPRKSTQFWLYLKDLSKQGIIELSVQNRHKDGKSAGRITTLSIIDIPVEKIIELLEGLD
ncbi:MAG: hypothetical protein EAX86_09680 [Candidatus Heimdallarchaeota archaeon]|nr:hypothetical protein [Candidatus Heimdallarchaeota archaeon]